MKKILTLSLIIPALVFSACTNNDTSGTETTTSLTEQQSAAKPLDVITEVLKIISIASPVAKTKDNISDFYQKLDVSKVKDASFYVCGSGAYPDEIAIFEFDSADSAVSGKEALQAHLDSQISSFKDYTPDEMYKLEGALIYTDGNYAVYVACENNAKAKEIIDSMI